MRFIFSLIVILQLQAIVISQEYKLIYKGNEFCKDPDPPYEEVKKIDVNVAVVNNSDNFYFKANFTVKETLSGYSWRFKKGFEKAGNVIFENDFKGLSCRTFIPRLIYGIAKINFDPKTCEMHKGNYSINKLEVRKLDRATTFNPTRRLGMNVFYLSYYKPQATCFCIKVRILLIKT